MAQIGDCVRQDLEKGMLPSGPTPDLVRSSDCNAYNIPTITEADLLLFQSSHFGDDTIPDVWFVDAETALSYEPRSNGWEYNVVTEDQNSINGELGYYTDGVKRTLTDEHIAMFRHSELEQMARNWRHLEEDEEEGHEHALSQHRVGGRRRSSAVSEASSIDVDLVGLARLTTRQAPPVLKRQQSRTSTSTSSSAGRRSRAADIPYDERHKRKWEQYIDGTDVLEGSLTHRRRARELDEKQDARVELEY